MEICLPLILSFKFLDSRDISIYRLKWADAYSQITQRSWANIGCYIEPALAANIGPASIFPTFICIYKYFLDAFSLTRSLNHMST